MHFGRQRAEWNRLSQLLALTATCHSTKQHEADQFNPYAEPPPQLTEADKEALAAQVLAELQEDFRKQLPGDPS